MRAISLIARRELGAYMRSVMGYVIVALVLLVDGFLFNYYALGGAPKKSGTVLQLFFAFATFMTMVAGILLSMRQVAEEKQLKTLTMLLASPAKEHEIILGKFFSGFIFLAGMTLLTIYMPLLIFVNGKVALGHIAAGYIGLLMLGGLSLAIGLFASAISPSQIVAAVSGAAMLAGLYLMYLGARVTDPPLKEIVAYLSPQQHLRWQLGVLETRDIFYYGSAIALFLMFATQVMRARRWR